MTAKEAENSILAVYPYADCVGDRWEGVWRIISDEMVLSTSLKSEADAWAVAASRIATPVEPKAQVDSGEELHLTLVEDRNGDKRHYQSDEVDVYIAKLKAQVESASVEPVPKDGEKTDVYEVFGSCATSRGWDFLVCTSLSNALENISDSLDSLEDGEEVKIVFRRYTKEQMDEVVYE